VNPKERKPKTTFIYGLTDPRTGQVRYVGKSNKPQRRLVEHIRYCTDQHTHKDHWIQQLLSEGVEPGMEILEECKYDQWKAREQHHIAIRKDLTNGTLGGDGRVAGSKFSKKALKNVRAAVKDSKGSVRMRKPLAQYTLDGKLVRSWKSARAAAEGVGKTRSVINRCARDESRQAHGFIWVFISEGEEPIDRLSDEEMHRRAMKFKKKRVSRKTRQKMSQNGTRRAVLQYTKEGDFVKEWASIKEAAAFVGLTGYAITQCASGRSRSSGGFAWKYTDGKSGGRLERAVAQYTKGGKFKKIWSSVQRVLSEYGYYPQSLYQCLQGRAKTCGGSIWFYVDSLDFVGGSLPDDQQFRLKSFRSKKVGQYELDGTLIRVWSSASAAAKSVGLSASTLARCARVHRNTAGGYVWKYVE
jgi:hypothetical protein